MSDFYPDGSPKGDTVFPIDSSDNVMLAGELADVWREFRAASADLELKTKAAHEAQQRFRAALDRLAPLAAKPEE